MIKIYQNGADFYKENKDFLLTNEYTEVFFRLDSLLLTATNYKEFAIKVYDETHTLLVLAKEPYNNLYFGDHCLCDELFSYLISNGYEIKDFIAEESLGKTLIKAFSTKKITYCLDIALDYMIAKKRFENLTSDIVYPTVCDIDEIYHLEKDFLIECGLKDQPNIEKIKSRINDYRVIKMDGKIVSLIKISAGSKSSYHISEVYTVPTYRNNHLSKALCVHALNEIIDKGYIATLNVDRSNKISNHLYKSIGFKKIFSQGIFVKK